MTATNSSGSAPATSPPTAVVGGAAPTNTAPPTIAGSAVEGQVLTAATGTWSGAPAPTFTYRWQDCNGAGTGCATISGATASTYTLVSADVGSTVEVVVTATNTGGSASATSAPTGLVTSAPGPLTPVLDNFNRANNTGPPSSSWSAMPAFQSPLASNLFITNQQITGVTGESADYWNTQPYGPNSEVYVTIAVKPTVNLDPVFLGLRYQSPGLTTSSGYRAAFIYSSTGLDQYKIYYQPGGSSGGTVLASATGPTLTAGDQLLFRAIGATLELWRGSGGTWTRILTATNATIQGAGYVALIERDGSVRLDNFGGGTLP